MIASEEPTVAVPATSLPSGALHSWEIIAMTRRWMTSVRGYSSLSTRFLLIDSIASLLASSSIHVVT